MEPDGPIHLARPAPPAEHARFLATRMTSPSIPPVHLEPAKHKTWKVLVIEDDARWRTLVELSLEGEGHTVLTAADGLAGLALATEKPDVILCDVEMPRLNGYAVLEALRQQPELRAIPFIFLTARSARSDQRKGMVLGARLSKHERRVFVLTGDGETFQFAVFCNQSATDMLEAHPRHVMIHRHLRQPPRGPVEQTERPVRRHLHHAAAIGRAMTEPYEPVVRQIRRPMLDLARDIENARHRRAHDPLVDLCDQLIRRWGTQFVVRVHGRG